MIDLIKIQDDEEDIVFQKSKPDILGSQYDLHPPISYVVASKKMAATYGKKEGYPFIGIVLFHNKDKKEVHVLYKDFLLKDPIKISATIKDRYMQTYIKKKYETITHYIIEKMPRVKKLKRLNLKMMNKEMTSYLYTYLNDIIDSYQYVNGYEQSQRFKASLITTPFYVNDNGYIKIYRMDKNELEIPEYEGANFLSYFTFTY